MEVSFGFLKKGKHSDNFKPEMSFFGITMHGPQNSFQQSLVNAVGVKFFTPEEYEIAFRKIDKDRNGYIDINEVEALLSATYGFEPLQEEVDAFMVNFDLNRDGRVTW
jgi:Ca2+-binding EF-hand superfamily protein